MADSFIEKIKQSYELRDMGTGEWFLGIRTVRNRTKKTMLLVGFWYGYCKGLLKAFNFFRKRFGLMMIGWWVYLDQMKSVDHSLEVIGSSSAYIW